MSEIMSPGDTPGRNALGMSRSTLFAAPTLIATGAHIRLLQALTAMPTGLRAVPSRIGSEINERPPPSTGKPNRRFVFCKNGAEASLLEARHSNGRHSAQFEMHCLRFCVFSTRTGLALRDGTGLAAPTDVAVARALSHGVRCARTLHAVAVHTAHPGAVVGVRRLRCKTKSRKQPD